MLLPIVFYPDPTLSRVSIPLELDQLAGTQMQKFFDDMIETMYKADGIGLAAPQINKNIRVAALAGENGLADIIINPKITSLSHRREEMEEGCLSLLGIFGEVSRPRSIIYQAFDRQGRLIKRKVTGLAARVVQHEIDHLDGILFASRAQKITANVNKLPLPSRRA